MTQSSGSATRREAWSARTSKLGKMSIFAGTCCQKSSGGHRKHQQVTSSVLGSSAHETQPATGWHTSVCRWNGVRAAHLVMNSGLGQEGMMNFGDSLKSSVSDALLVWSPLGTQWKPSQEPNPSPHKHYIRSLGWVFARAVQRTYSLKQMTCCM